MARRGRQVTLLEQFGPGHHNGASHGSTRNLNPGYYRPEYVAMLAEGLALWDELEQDSGERLLTRTGIVNHGPDPRLPLVEAALTEAGIRAESLRPEEAAGRWRGIRFDQQVLYMPDGGQLNPEAALPAFQRLAAARGAEIRHHTKVLDLEIMDDGVRLTMEVGGAENGGGGMGHGGTGGGGTGGSGATGTIEVVTAAQAVVTAGAWTAKLLSAAAGSRKLRIPRLRVTQEQPAHFRVADDQAVWPGFNHTPGPGADYKDWYSPVYGMQTPVRASRPAGTALAPKWTRTGGPSSPNPSSSPRCRTMPGPGCPGLTPIPSRPSAARTPPHRTKTSSLTGSAPSLSVRASPATASSSPRWWDGSSPTSPPAPGLHRRSSRHPGRFRVAAGASR
ncbi:hypothetical protein GCM10009712_29330 [Pseudarthrobacter sulfonivorans]